MMAALALALIRDQLVGSHNRKMYSTFFNFIYYIQFNKNRWRTIYKILIILES